MSAQKKPAHNFHQLYAVSPSQDKKIVEDLKQKLNGLLERDPKMARKAALIIEQWLRQKPGSKS
ncbi:MAG: hypothetical protein K2P81_16620 [Bacteriovoracaceae bacterium]|nr:hypothetical protein [Bacteriovoracaceae bacterium]